MRTRADSSRLPATERPPGALACRHPDPRRLAQDGGQLASVTSAARPWCSTRPAPADQTHGAERRPPRPGHDAVWSRRGPVHGAERHPPRWSQVLGRAWLLLREHVFGDPEGEPPL